MEILQYLGIDVSKDSLVFCLRRAGQKDLDESVANSKEGLNSLLELLGDKIQGTVVTLEATSRYHRLAERTLSEAGAQVQVMNPLQARSLAIGLGILDKDDKIDARVLVEAAQHVPHREASLKSASHEDLRDLSRVIDSLTNLNAENKKRLAQLPKEGNAYRVLQGAIKAIRSQIKAAKSEWAKLAKQDKEIQRRYNLALSIQDVGEESARVVACELPAKLEDHKDAQLCAYAGVVPRKKQSGQQKERTAIGKRGNAHLRTGLFMAATHSVYQSKRNSDFYARLRAKGKTHVQAVIAVVHKLLRQILVVLRRDSPWVIEPTVTPIAVGA
jgi:transposase